MLEGGPGSRIFLCCVWRRGVGEVGEDIFLDAGWDGLSRRCDDAVEESGVGGVGEGVTAGFDGAAGVEIAIGERVTGIARLARDFLAAAGCRGEGRAGRRLRVSVRCGGDGCRGTGGGRRSEAGESQVERIVRLDDAVKVLLLGGFSRAFDGGELDGADLGKDEEQTGKGVGADAGFTPELVPVIVGGQPRRSRPRAG